MRQPNQPSTPVGTEVQWDGEDCTIVGTIYYGDAGWFYVVLDEFQEEHDVHCNDIDGYEPQIDREDDDDYDEDDDD